MFTNGSKGMLDKIHLVYECGLCLWTLATFIVSAPGINEKFLETTMVKSLFTCQGIMDEKTCREVLTYEIFYRLFLVITVYHFILAFILLPNFPAIREHLHNECWVFKLLSLAAISIGALYIPQHSYFIVYFSYVVLIGSSLFIMFQFFLWVDLAEALGAWVTEQQEKGSKRKTSFKVMLVLLICNSYLLLAVSLGTVAYILVVASTQNCIWNDIFIVLILGASFISFGITWHPRIRTNIQTSAVILPCAVVIFHSVFVMVLALTIQGGRGCNLEGTFLSRQKISTRVHLKSIIALSLMHTAIVYECLRSSRDSFTLGLLKDTKTDEENLSYSYSAFHFLMSTGSMYTLATLTNWYGPIINRFSQNDKSSLVGLQADWKPAQIVTITTSCIPLLLYISFIIYAILTLDPHIQSQVLSGGSIYLPLEPKAGCEVESKNTFSPHANRKNYVESIRNGALASSDEILRVGKSEQDYPSQKQGTNLLVRCERVRDTSVFFYHFPREICQSYYGGRNGSNACTVIAVLIAKAFCCGNLDLPETDLLDESWINLYRSCIAEGNRLYDMVINLKKQGAIYLSVEDVVEEFGDMLQIKNLGFSLPVSFVSETETATVSYQLERLRKFNEKSAVIFIKDSRSGVFLFFKDGPLLFADSHPYGSGGALLVCSSNVNELVMYLAEILRVTSLKGLGALSPIYF